MKQLFILFLIIAPLEIFGQAKYQSVELELDTLISRVSGINTDSAKKSLRIASFLFNSREFQDSILKLQFPGQNHCNGCDNDESQTGVITGKFILDSLFRKPNQLLKLYLKKVGKIPMFGKCWGLGNTCPNTDSITSFYRNINCLMGDDLPFVYSYAVHLCHEFSHNVGFCHTNNKVESDIAEAIGEIAFFFINKWYHESVLPNL